MDIGWGGDYCLLRILLLIEFPCLNEWPYIHAQWIALTEQRTVFSLKKHGFWKLVCWRNIKGVEDSK